jgi:phosphatidylethanolamine-binding protein (PEBP) family uncharacterized protein
VTLLGHLLKNRRSRDVHSAWNRPNLLGPELLTVTSQDFKEGESIPRDHAGKRVGGKKLSPQLSWSPPPPETTQLVLVIEDLDVPTSKPAVHCLVLIDPSRLDSPNQVPPGGLSAKTPAPGVQILRSTILRGYQGPEPIKGHGPHRYTFQIFAFADQPVSTIDGAKLNRTGPRQLLSSLTAPVVARGRLTGTYER